MKALLILCTFCISVILSNAQKRVVCYYTNWSVYREGNGMFTVQDIDPSKCTNVLYAFASLDINSLTIVPSDPYLDLTRDNYRQFVNRCKSNPNCKPSLALGGWTDSATDKYSRMLNSDSSRAKFINTTIDYLAKYGFEGLDLDIEYPACPQGECSRGNPRDRDAFQKLIKELRTEFNKRGWVLSAAIPGYPNQITTSYNVKELSNVLDWVGVMTYDYHSSGNSVTGPVSPLRTSNNDGSTEKSINFILSQGASRNKLVVGLPAYGYTYKLASANQNGYNAPSTGPGVMGQYTKSPGSVAYYEICQFIFTNGWTVKEDSMLGAYAYKSNDWVSYNSVNDVIRKADLVNQMQLAGLMVWDITTDDFKGKFCKQGVNPILSAMKNNLR